LAFSHSRRGFAPGRGEGKKPLRPSRPAPPPASGRAFSPFPRAGGSWDHGMNSNTLYYGDCLSILGGLPDGVADLIYLDPPFKSDEDYNLIHRTPDGHVSGAQVSAFKDTWSWSDVSAEEINNLEHSEYNTFINGLKSFLGQSSIMAYIVMMTSRLIEMRRVLKDTGSIYLHCDPEASHYLKIVMDRIFGQKNFRNEIIWRRTGAHNKSEKWGPVHDVLLYYTKSERYIWNHPKQPYMTGHVRKYFIEDEKGYKTNYYGNVLTGSGIRSGESGKPWMGIDPTTKGRHWAIPGKLWEDSGLDDSGLSQHQKLDMLKNAGFISFTDGDAWPVYERRVRPDDGPATGDIWAYQPYTEGTVFGSQACIDADVAWLKPNDKERLGYPTQKPVGLLERIIRASSNPGEVVLDPFCGCGTSIEAAIKLHRRWIGIDVTHLAISLIESRIKRMPRSPKYAVRGAPQDIDAARDLAERDKYQFQCWACSLLGAMPFQKGPDGGKDGVIFFEDNPERRVKKALVSVKGGKTGVSDIREFMQVVEKEKAQIGAFVTLNKPTRPMLDAARDAGFYSSEYQGKKIRRMQILTVEGLLNGTERFDYVDFTMGMSTIARPKHGQAVKRRQMKLL
jgi:site-specific DNA-methyltransferase (adenine-specific)